tara:strand:- start:190 stop:432 length:243 start_codon:yes stop_codon:yes gene_type:complete
MFMTFNIDNFQRNDVYPYALERVLLNQIIFLSLIVLAIVKFIPLIAAFEVDITVAAASPRGAVSNLISHLYRKNTPYCLS